ncbi:MAG: RNA methyltransferase [Ornithinimicrobium sp.]
MPERRTVLVSPRSERVRSVAALGRRAARQRSERFLVEGPHAVRELLSYAAAHVVDVYVTPQGARTHSDILELAREARAGVYECAEEIMAFMADAQHPQGVLAVARRIDVSLAQALAQVGDGFAVVLSNVRDPGNAGTVIRAADAFGAAAVVITDASVDLHNPKVIRSTVGSAFHVPIATGSSVTEAITACRQAGLRVYAADGGSSLVLPDVDLSGPHAWVLGNEAWGLPSQIREQCDDVVAVPIVGHAESLNLAMAATVCLHTSSLGRPR